MRAQALETLAKTSAHAANRVVHQWLAAHEDGRVKLFVIHALLHIRAAHRRLFEEGDYVPLEVAGQLARHAVAFLRTDGDDHLLVVVPRFLNSLTGPEAMPTGSLLWSDTSISLPGNTSGLWFNIITAQRLEVEGDLYVAAALAEFPIGVLLKDTGHE